MLGSDNGFQSKSTSLIASSILLGGYLLSRFFVTKHDTIFSQSDILILQILGAGFIMSIILSSLGNILTKSLFKNANKEGINIRKIIAFIIVVAFIAYLFLSSDEDSLDTIKEVVLVIIAFYFGQNSAQQQTKPFHRAGRRKRN